MKNLTNTVAVITGAASGIGMKPDVRGKLVVQAVKDERFYIIADPERTKRSVRLRMEGILNETRPSPEAAV